LNPEPPEYEALDLGVPFKVSKRRILYTLFNDVVNSSDYTASNGSVISER
jgi:hypothetical protein